MSLKIAFVTPYYDPRDIRRGSGTFYYMSRELERQGCQLSNFGPVAFREPAVVRPLRAFAKRVQKGRYLTYLDPAVARALGKELSAQLEGQSFDLVLTNDPGVAAGLDVPFPVVYYSDVMLPASSRANDLRELVAYRQVPIWALRRYQKTMRLCLERSALAIFPAQWQLDQAKGYGVDPAKIHLVSFGANIPDPGPEMAERRDFGRNARQRQVNLLFVGTDWERKGGDIAVAVTNLLREEGVDARLDVVGKNLQGMPSHIRSYGQLRKDNPEEWVLMDELYRASDVFVLPSRSEGSVIAPREAAAYGLPTLAYRIEGLMSSVIDGKSGLLLEPGTGPEGYAKVILNWLDTPKTYQRLCHGAREFYETNANWSTCVAKLVIELESQIKAHQV